MMSGRQQGSGFASDPLFETFEYISFAANKSLLQREAGQASDIPGLISLFVGLHTERTGQMGLAASGSSVCFFNRKSSKSEGKFLTFGRGILHYPKETWCLAFSGLFPDPPLVGEAVV